MLIINQCQNWLEMRHIGVLFVQGQHQNVESKLPRRLFKQDFMSGKNLSISDLAPTKIDKQTHPPDFALTNTE